MRESGDGEARGSLVFKLAGAWALVGIPLAWGVWQVFQKSLDLFR
jgi:hypothetical protein